MQQDIQNALDAMSRDSDRLKAAIFELMEHFPSTANWLAWQDKIFTEQRKYLTRPNDPHDYQLEIAVRWVNLARKGRLQAALDDRGLSVIELDGEALKPADLETVLFKKLKELNGQKGLLYPDLFAEVQSRLGLSLSQQWDVFMAVLKSLSDKRYLRHEKLPNGMLRINQGIDFDEWCDMRAKPPSSSVTNNSYTFNGKVGAVQTGASSVANVHQAADANQYTDLKIALESLMQELSTSGLPLDERQDAEELIGKAVQEIESDKPSKGVLKALCSGLATTVQTLGSASAAYQAVAAAFAVFGVSLG